MKIETILVPLDGSALAEAALPTALGLLAEQPGTTLLLLRAAEATTMLGDPVAAQVDVVREAEEYLKTLAARLSTWKAPKVETAVWYGAPAPAIVEAARVANADLIVMSTHGRSGIGRLVLGSVAESVLRGTSTPILLVRPGSAPLQRPAGAAAPKEAARV
ncbi:MAG: universal stress protein [Candidatus Rokubacteria bacterium]|nr:universal stress protein [Candidatus Rokubacteria bacterium]